MKKMIENYSNYIVDYAFGIPTCEPFIDFHYRTNMPCNDLIARSLRLFF